MAAGPSLSQISDDFLGCQICLQPCRRPKVLSCLHTFCQECLELLLKRQEEQHQLECPTCRNKTQLSGSGVAGLKDNFFVESLNDTVKLHKTVMETEGCSSSNVACGACESKGEAKSYCVECGDFICEECNSAHRRMKSLKGHQLVGMEDFRSGAVVKAAKLRTQPCRLHEDESLKFFCQTCGEAVCRDCIIMEHKGHSYTHLSEASAAIKEELATALQNSDKKVAELNKKQQEILDKKSLLKDTVSKVQDKINEAAEQTRNRLKRMLDRVDAEEKELLQKVQVIEKKTEEKFCAVQDTLETTIVSLFSTREFGRSIMAHGTDLQVVSVKTEVQSRLQSLLQLSPTDIRAPAGEPWVRFDPDVAVKVDNDVLLVGDITEGFKATFTTLGTEGRLGPTKLGEHYSGQDHDGLVTLNNGIQHFKVKHTGTYQIEAAGAAAGTDRNTSPECRGRGAVMKGTFQLNKGEVLKILVGQEGAENRGYNSGAGGGGGTFVTRDDNTPLIIAGGGGGGTGRSYHSIFSDGNTKTAGNSSTRSWNVNWNEGGEDGDGAVEWGSGSVGGGGGGLLTDGASGKNKFGGRDGGEDGGEGGKAFFNGGEGGRGSYGADAYGGFGGGGGGYGKSAEGKLAGGGGGGGGYSGGARGEARRGGCAGGGGSFNSGIDSVSAGVCYPKDIDGNNGPGYVIVTLIK
ncbi:PREDICTED: keratin, type I cytoskeletal 9-like [Branchiostoma belcheri]|uniref:Keratin, type I cytoskeletal 9-like n=1 Tax=Branchiostoma belcheri TaxID=7741 RepID=A0A6P4YA23_BRABE|nr:PREDICTED: keratin, type I cytoskeletal 9-like [Branchiostoma belcheri]